MSRFYPDIFSYSNNNMHLLCYYWIIRIISVTGSILFHGDYSVKLKKIDIFKIKVHNRYGVGNRVRKFEVSTMKIEPVTRFWSSLIISARLTQHFHKRKLVYKLYLIISIYRIIKYIIFNYLKTNFWHEIKLYEKKLFHIVWGVWGVSK